MEYEKYVQLSYLRDCKNTYLSGDIEVKITSYHQIPLSSSKKKQKMMENGEIRPRKKPDIDNMAKAILDSLNGIAYKDDSHIVKLEFLKYYSYRPRIEIELRGE